MKTTPSPFPLGIDLDGTIDEAPQFFEQLTHLWPGEVYIITYRDDRQKAIDRLAEFNIRYDHVILVSSFEAKAEVIGKHRIQVYFDDMDEMLMHIPESVQVFKIRNGGNFDFDSKRWLYSRQTGHCL